MSRWTHIAGAMIIDSHKSLKQEEAYNYYIKVLENAPKITGSERDADVFINVVPGYNESSWEDDKRVEYQSKVVITIAGDLRDTDEEQVTDELNTFFEYITKKLDWDIEEHSFIIDDEYIDVNKYFEYKFK